MIQTKDVQANVRSNLDNNLLAFDKEKKQGLDELKTYHTVKLEMLTKEYKIYEESEEKDESLMNQLLERIEFIKAMLVNLETLIVEANLLTEAVDEFAWNLNGKVLDDEQKPMENASVAFFNENGEYLENLGISYTDKNGYFSLKHRVDDISEDQFDNLPEVYVQVVDTANKVRYREKVAIKPGEMDYRAISLPKESGLMVSPKADPWKAGKMEKEWGIYGSVRDEKGKIIPGTRVSLYDKDLIFDDHLGTRDTDSKGNFTFSFSSKDFKDFFEEKPDLYIKVFDKSGNLIHTSKDKVKYKADTIEELKIVVKNKGLKKK